MSDNPQFLRTDKAIMQALISLMREKPFEKITVQDILDETPVTRATFYAHYHDKYEIVERMLSHFFAMKEAARAKVSTASASRTQEFIQKMYLDNRELIEALQKIHTEKVDFRQAVANELEQEYLSGSDSPSRKIEARIYAQAMTELHLSFAEDEHPDFSPEYWNRVFIAVAMKLMNLTGDMETWNFLNKKVSHK